MKKILRHKKLLLFAVLIVGAAVFIFLNKNKSEPAVSSNVISLKRNTLEQIISVKSPLEGIEKAEVVSPLNYEIIDIKVKEGDIVKKDQILAVLDSEDLQKEISLGEKQLELAKLEQQDKLKELQIQYDKLILQLNDLENEYNRNKELLENEIITEEAFIETENNLNELKKSLEMYNITDGRVIPTLTETKRLEIQREELDQKKNDLEKVFIKSPINGTVTRVNVNLGRYANETENESSMFVIENLDKLQMKVYISEFDIIKIKKGQNVEIYSDILGQNFVKGIVSRISPTAEQKDNNNMERVIPVLIEVTEDHENLIAGVIATAKIKVAKAENVLSVPSGAIILDEGSNYKIYILNDDNSIKSIPVEIGLETDLETEISSSELTEGMKIVVNPDYSFTDGMIVEPNVNSAE